MFNSRPLALCLITIILCFETPALSVWVASPPTDDPPPSPAWGPLAGPRIPDHAAPGVVITFGNNALAGRLARRANLQIYLRVLRSMQLPPDLQDRIRTIIEPYTDETRAYEQAHAAEFRELRAAARPASVDNPDSPARAAALTRLAELRRNNPDDGPYLIEIFDALPPAQQQDFRARIDAILSTPPGMDMSPDSAPSTPTMGEAIRAVPSDSPTTPDSSLSPRDRQILERLRARDRALEASRNLPAPPPGSVDDIVFDDSSTLIHQLNPTSAADSKP